MNEPMGTILDFNIENFEIAAMALEGDLSKKFRELKRAVSYIQNKYDSLIKKSDNSVGKCIVGVLPLIPENSYIAHIIAYEASKLSDRCEFKKPYYPDQWLEYMSEESANWLYEFMKNNGFDLVEKYGPFKIPKELQNKGFLENYFSWDEVGVSKASFLTGGLELPDCVDEEVLS